MPFSATIQIRCDYCLKNEVSVPAGTAYYKGGGVNRPEYAFILEDRWEHPELADWEIDDLKEYSAHPEAVCPDCIAAGEVEVVAYIKQGMIMNPGTPPKMMWRKPTVINRGGWFREKYFIIFDPHTAFLVEASNAQEAYDFLFDDEEHGNVFAVPEQEWNELDPDFTSYAGNDGRPIVDNTTCFEVQVNWKANTWALDKFGVPMDYHQAWQLKKEEWSKK